MIVILRPFPDSLTPQNLLHKLFPVVPSLSVKAAPQIYSSARAPAMWDEVEHARGEILLSDRMRPHKM